MWRVDRSKGWRARVETETSKVTEIIQVRDDGVLDQTAVLELGRISLILIFKDEVEITLRRGCERQRKVKNGSKFFTYTMEKSSYHLLRREA